MESTRISRRGRTTRPSDRRAPGSRRPVEYTLTKPRDPDVPDNAAGLETERAALESPDYGMLVLGALQASLTLFMTQAAVSVLLANAAGHAVEIRFAAGVIPYLGIATSPSSFVSTLTWTTAAAVVMTAIGTLWNLWRRRDTPMFVVGWATGLLMALGLLAIQFFRHLMNPPMVDTWILAQATAFVVAAGLIFVAFRPTVTKGSHPSQQSAALGRTELKETAS